ncbi:MAG: sigma-70 family RNA polymerase sigma factor [Symbiobacteriaceae bacterium]|nr:sigma-70 family RNA polymerase sigma factor [Symbiobacteriaceae bacterium]
METDPQREEYVAVVKCIYEEERRILFRFALKLGSSEQDAEDSLDEVFCNLIKRDQEEWMKEFCDKTPRQRLTYVQACMVNQVKSTGMRNTAILSREQNYTSLVQPLERDNDPEEELLNSEITQTLTDLVNLLPDDQATIIMMIGEGYKPKEIGSILGMTDTKVRTYRDRVIEKLKRSRTLERLVGGGDSDE